MAVGYPRAHPVAVPIAQPPQPLVHSQPRSYAAVPRALVAGVVARPEQQPPRGVPIAPQVASLPREPFLLRPRIYLWRPTAKPPPTALTAKRVTRSSRPELRKKLDQLAKFTWYMPNDTLAKHLFHSLVKMDGASVLDWCMIFASLSARMEGTMHC